jgi:ABC-2 type transport system ATP-binding protein
VRFRPEKLEVNMTATLEKRSSPTTLLNDSSSTHPAIRVDELTKRFGDFTAVDSVSFEVPKGSIFGFLGPNGAGKTTTLGVMLGLIPATSGTATILGYDIHTDLPEALRRTGAMVEKPALYPYMSGRDNLRLWAYLAGIDDPNRVERALKTVDLIGRANAKFGSYSTGMKQRLGIATALLRDPELVILDEPTNGLDPAGQREVRALIRNLAREGRTVILSSHLLYEVQEICTDVAIINHGRMIASGKMEDVLHTRDSIEVRIDRPTEAVSFLKQIPGVEEVRLVDDLAVVTVDIARIGQINRRLVEAGFEVTELRPRQRRLEDQFLALTGQEQRQGESDGTT